MDRIALREKGRYVLRKYKYVLLILALGLVLMCLPDGQPVEEAPAPEMTVESLSLTEELEEILSQIQGAGKVKVMLSTATGEQTHYQTDEDQSSDTTRRDTVIVTGDDRSQQGLVRQVDPPTYLGAVVVCQGADRPQVQLAIVQAVANVTGLGADRISVLKMK